MPDTHRRHFLKDKETREFLAQASTKLHFDVEKIFGKKPRVEIVEIEDISVILVDSSPVFLRSDGCLYPSLIFEKHISTAPKIVVDMGAVPYVCKGANIMAPGVRRVEGDFVSGDIVYIVDERYGKALALAEALADSSVIRGLRKGVIAKNLHFVGDEKWALVRQFTP